MQVDNQKVVTLDYTLTESQGEILDQSQGGDFSYLHGSGNIIPGLEQALEGKQPGEELSVTLNPDDAYGERDERLIQSVPKDMFPEGTEVTVGSQFQAQGPDGAPIPLVVTNIGDQEVEVDANHPLAGETLNFEVKVVDVREATDGEIEEGQPQAGAA